MKKLFVLALFAVFSITILPAAMMVSGDTVNIGPAELPAVVDLSGFYGAVIGFYSTPVETNGFYSGDPCPEVLLDTVVTANNGVTGSGSADIAWTIVSGMPIEIGLSSTQGALHADGIEGTIGWTATFTSEAAGAESITIGSNGNYSGSAFYTHEGTSLLTHGSGNISITTDDAGNMPPASYVSDITITISPAD